MRQPVARTHVAQSRSDSPRAAPLWRLHRVQHGLTLAFIVVIGVALRLYLIHQPLHYDEAYTYLHFASRGIRAVITDYHAPNNHVLHSVLVRISYGVFGHDPWALRVPAAAAGVLLIPAVYVVGRLFHGSAAGLIAAAITSGSGLIDRVLREFTRLLDARASVHGALPALLADGACRDGPTSDADRLRCRRGAGLLHHSRDGVSRGCHVVVDPCHCVASDARNPRPDSAFCSISPSRSRWAAS
jgi:hypothetical protein